jgi:hypothetical protein
VVLKQDSTLHHKTKNTKDCFWKESLREKKKEKEKENVKFAGIFACLSFLFSKIYLFPW